MYLAIRLGVAVLQYGGGKHYLFISLKAEFNNWISMYIVKLFRPMPIDTKFWLIEHMSTSTHWYDKKGSSRMNSGAVQVDVYSGAT